MTDSPLDTVNAEGTVLKTVSVASNGEQIGAASIGLLTAGPIGALAAWGAIRMFAGKWTPWMLTGIIAVIPINVFQLLAITSISTLFEAYDVELVAPSTSNE